MKTLIKKSVLAGLLIGMAGWIFLICQNLNIDGWTKVIGSAAFSIGLVAVVGLEANLYTGKVGYINSKKTLLDGLIILGVNLVAAFLLGLLYRGCIGTSTAMDSRLAKTWYRVLVDGIGCGAIIYLAVEIYKKTKSFVPIILGVIVFILAQFEHCIADAFYFGASELTWKGLGYIGLVIVGNSIGSLGVRWLQVGILGDK